MSDSEKSFCRNLSHKSKSRENVGALLNGMGDPVTEDRKNAEKSNAFFVSVFMSKIVFHKP